MNSESAINVWTERPKWFGRINIEEYEKLASIGYTPQQIAMYYDIDVGDFMFYFTLLRSPLKYHYDRGQLLQQAKEGVSMTDAAALGENVTQAQRLDKFRSGADLKEISAARHMLQSILLRRKRPPKTIRYMIGWL